jgi:hypothetical protein
VRWRRRFTTVRAPEAITDAAHFHRTGWLAESRELLGVTNRSIDISTRRAGAALSLDRKDLLASLRTPRPAACGGRRANSTICHNASRRHHALRQSSCTGQGRLRFQPYRDGSGGVGSRQALVIVPTNARSGLDGEGRHRAGGARRYGRALCHPSRHSRILSRLAVSTTTQWDTRGGGPVGRPRRA